VGRPLRATLPFPLTASSIAAALTQCGGAQKKDRKHDKHDKHDRKRRRRSRSASSSDSEREQKRRREPSPRRRDASPPPAYLLPTRPPPPPGWMPPPSAAPARAIPAAQQLKAAVRAAGGGGGRWGKPAKAGGGGGLAAYLKCACCHVDCSGEDAFLQHINGRAHKKKSRGRLFCGLLPNSQGVIPPIAHPGLRAEAAAFGLNPDGAALERGPWAPPTHYVHLEPWLSSIAQDALYRTRQLHDDAPAAAKVADRDGKRTAPREPRMLEPPPPPPPVPGGGPHADVRRALPVFKFRDKVRLPPLPPRPRPRAAPPVRRGRDAAGAGAAGAGGASGACEPG
jgi:hypothetical protein